MGTSKNIMWDDVQDALPVLNMCRDLYTARLHKQLKLEQQLYVELINLLRSPETLLLRTGEFIHYWPKEQSSSESSSSSSSSSSGESDGDADGELEPVAGVPDADKEEHSSGSSSNSSLVVSPAGSRRGSATVPAPPAASEAYRPAA
jgi:hypothetical protein